MNTKKIIRVWGVADGTPLELTLEGGDWVCRLPPDMEDGQYAVQLFAESENGSIGVWTGILYIANGISCIHLSREKYTLWLCAGGSPLALRHEPVKIKLVRECRCV